MAKFIVEGVGEFQWDRTKLSLLEAMDMERVTKTPVGDLIKDFNGGNDPTGQGKKGMRGLAAFLWVAMRRNGSNATFAEVAAFDVGTITESFDDELPEEESAEPDPPVVPPAGKKGGSVRKKASSPPK